MGFGLGKNTPIVLSQNRSNFEALIDRHGQWVRWRTARKCACVTSENEPDIHCEKCGGSGDIYDFQKSYKETLPLTVRDNIAELPAQNVDCEVLQVYDSNGNDFNFVKKGCFIEIKSGTRQLNQNEIVEALICQPTVKRLETVTLEKVGNGFYSASGIETPPAKLEGVYYKAPGDIVNVERVENAKGEVIGVKGFRQNMIEITEAQDANEPLTAFGVDYILPHKFIVLSQNLNKADERLLQAHNGEAVCTYPYMFDVAENDCITVLSGAMTTKAIITKRETDDIIPEFFVSSITSLETKDKEYKEGVDFMLAGTNRIHWLTENAPLVGDAMSLVYKYNPTYRVAKNISMLRTSENQRIPRKVILRLFSAFAESRRLQHG